MKLRRADGLLLALALLLEGALIGRYWQPRSAGHTALVQGPTEQIRVDLRRPQQLQIQGAQGPSTLVVRDGAIAFTDSPCQRKLCIRSGAHRHAGATTACVPNRVSVSIAGRRVDGFDALHY